MSFQVLNDPSVGANSRAFGEGLNAALQGLVSHKVGQIQQHKQRQETSRGLQALGYSPHEAAELSQFDPQIVGEIVKSKVKQIHSPEYQQQKWQQQQYQQQVQQQQQQRQEQQTGLQALQEQQQQMQQQPQVPYRPGYTGLKQPEYGGREQQALAQQIQQQKQQLAKPQQTPSLASGLAASQSQATTKGLTAAQSLKHEQETQKKIKAKEHVQEAYDRVKEILDTGYTGYSLTGLTPEGRELRSELDTLSEIFLANLIPLLNPRGAISKDRFNYLKGLIPNSWDTDAAMKGKLEALKATFGLEGSSPSDESDTPPQEMVNRSPEGQIFYNDGVPKFIKKNGKLERA